MERDRKQGLIRFIVILSIVGLAIVAFISGCATTNQTNYPGTDPEIFEITYSSFGDANCSVIKHKGQNFVFKTRKYLRKAYRVIDIPKLFTERGWVKIRYWYAGDVRQTFGYKYGRSQVGYSGGVGARMICRQVSQGYIR